MFKDRILYMVNIRKLRRGILPGILVTLLLAGGNLVFNVSAGTDTVSVETEKSGIEKNAGSSFVSASVFSSSSTESSVSAFSVTSPSSCV